MNKLQDKTAVITGGSSGIGLATAKRFAEEGAHVFIFGRRQSELNKAVDHIGRNVTAVQGDVTRMEDLDRLYSKVKAERGSVDVLFANSGFVEHQADSNRPPLTVATSQIRAGGAGFQPTCFECRGIPIALLCYGRLSDRGSV